MTTGVPSDIVRFFREPRRRAHSLLVKATRDADATRLLIDIGRELDRPSLYGLNYLNTAETAEKLSEKFRSYRRYFVHAGLTEDWTQLPPRRSVPRERLEVLLEWIRQGLEGSRRPFGVLDDTADENGVYDPPPPQDRAPEIDDWGSAKEAAAPLPVVPKREPVLPKFERLWDCLERVAKLPGLILIEHLEMLATEYGVEAWKLLDVLQKDLVETGTANVVVVVDGDRTESFEHIADGAVSFVPRPHPQGPRWLLTFERLPGQTVRQRKYEMILKQGRLARCASDDDLVDEMADPEATYWKPGIPTEIVRFFGKRDSAFSLT